MQFWQHGRCCAVLHQKPEGLPGVFPAKHGDSSRAETLQTNFAIRFRILPILQHCTHLKRRLAPSAQNGCLESHAPKQAKILIASHAWLGPPQQTRQCSSLPAPASQLLLALQEPGSHLTINQAEMINGLRDNLPAAALILPC